MKYVCVNIEYLDACKYIMRFMAVNNTIITKPKYEHFEKILHLVTLIWLCTIAMTNKKHSESKK